jgi:biopolymer transport protein ExbB/TolQ
MKFQFQMAELLVTGSVVLFCAGISTWPIAFFGLGLFLAFARYAVELQEKNSLAQELEKSIATFKDALPDVLQAVARHTGSKKSEHKDKGWN